LREHFQDLPISSHHIIIDHHHHIIMDTTSQSPNHDNDSERRPPLSSSSIPECLEAEKNETEEWMELMGEDLLLKVRIDKALPSRLFMHVKSHDASRTITHNHLIRKYMEEKMQCHVK
jgi:hypothetical protein